jgi:digalactosyldiacylglycerol synthase
MKKEVTREDLPAEFHGARDHALLTDYKVFVNPSTSEVLCTTVVEALAMGKWVVVPKHPSNEFFEQFPNCLTYRTTDEAAANVYWALQNDPAPLTKELRYTLTWEAATDRLISASMITAAMHSNARTQQNTNKFIGWIHEVMSRGDHGDLMRMMAGGRGVASQMEYMKEHGTAKANYSLSEDKEENVGEVPIVSTV